jgi:hypothetical protein
MRNLKAALCKFQNFLELGVFKYYEIRARVRVQAFPGPGGIYLSNEIRRNMFV